MKKCFNILKDLNVFAIKEKGDHIYYCVDEIVYTKSGGDYFRIYHPKSLCLINRLLKKISLNLPVHFITPKKSYILNMRRVKNVKYCL